MARGTLSRLGPVPVARRGLPPLRLRSGDMTTAPTPPRPVTWRFRGHILGVGTAEGAGYGFAGKPVEPPGFRDRQRRQRAARAKAAEAVGS